MTDAPPPFTVALTGGIASGKSTVAERFAALGADVLDADLVARELVAPGSDALAEIVDTFGTSVLDERGGLDRRAMRERIFHDAAARARLEGILHPRIRAELRARAMRSRGPFVVLVIPLLAEKGHYDWVDRVLVVDAPREVQRERLLARDGIDGALADAMLDAQASREQRLSIADDVLKNAGTRDDLNGLAADSFARYRTLAARKSALRYD